MEEELLKALLSTISFARYGSSAADNPSGSAPRKRPTAESASAQMMTSLPASIASSARCAGSDSWNSSTMIVVKRARKAARTSGLLCRCSAARDTNSDGSILILASVALISRITMEFKYLFQNAAAPCQYFSPSDLPRAASSSASMPRSDARRIKSRSSRAKPFVVRAACKSSGHSL